MVTSLKPALDFYRKAKSFVDLAGFADEVIWQESRKFLDFTEPDFLCEAAWVILCSGFREAVVRKSFNYISLCFCDWESSSSIVENSNLCRTTALASFKNHRKIDAIISIAYHIDQIGFEQFRSIVCGNPIEQLQVLPFIGPITSWHLGKNLGLEVAKPDRHLIKIAQMLDFSDPHILCENIADATGDAVSTVDIVLWRFAASSDEWKQLTRT